MIGPIMLDVQGTSLSQEDKELLQHPLVGGVILFSRNYHEPKQLRALTQSIKSSAKQDMLIAVDHEGGRVQRFRDQFSAIPAMASIWQKHQDNLASALQSAKYYGQLMAQEVLLAGIDISFAPVLDIYGISEVIGDRSFHQQPEMVTQLAGAFIDGMHAAGMKATGKHFPGHGSVLEDSHIALPVDHRSMQAIFALDILPFQQLIQANKLDAMMPAHIIFPQVDPHAVGFSPLWLQQILRQQLGFDGVIFSDDLTMQGAASIGGYVERAEAAQQAGCDMLLVCNKRDAAIDIIEHASIRLIAASGARLTKLLAKSS
jgi:beta-N-acetylhexosaminidase